MTAPLRVRRAYADSAGLQLHYRQAVAAGAPVLVYAGDADPLHGAVVPTLDLLPHGVATTLPGDERTYVCERQADVVAARLADFFFNCGA